MPASPPLLAQLHDIHLPKSVAWWPLAPGWWMVIGAILLLIAITWWLVRRHHKQRWRCSALTQLHQELEQLRCNHQQTGDGAAACAALSSLIRRVALQVFPTASIAGIHGEPWLQFLDEKALITEQFSGSEWGAMLLTAPFSSAAVDPEALIIHSQTWMEAAIQLPPHQQGATSP